MSNLESAPPFQSGKPEPRMQPSIPYRISPGQTLAAERLSLHASMLRAPECLYKSRNVHERPGFCHQRGAGAQADATNAIGAKRRPDPPWARAANAKEPPPGAGSLFARGFGEANRARRGLSGKGRPAPGGKGAGLVGLVEQVHGSAHGVEGHAQGHGAYDGQRYGHGAP